MSFPDILDFAETLARGDADDAHERLCQHFEERIDEILEDVVTHFPQHARSTIRVGGAPTRCRPGSSVARSRSASIPMSSRSTTRATWSTVHGACTPTTVAYSPRSCIVPHLLCPRQGRRNDEAPHFESHGVFRQYAVSASIRLKSIGDVLPHLTARPLGIPRVQDVTPRQNS